ncbi:MAG: GAF domain-containing protein [Chloroflexi bacterium]|nr:GAF domain-containing protein [Chloroflexota bacterium]
MNKTGQPFLEAIKLCKRYGGVEALRDLDLDIYPGEIIGVVGDTDSGKSTLLSLISGILKPDTGRFYVRGKRARLSPSYRAARLGIRVVHQDINIAEHMSALGYIFAGQTPNTQRFLPRWIGWWNDQHLQEYAEKEFVRLGFEVPPLDCPLNDLTSIQRQMVAFVHATIWTPDLLLLDEPINALETYKPNILRLIRETRDRGGSVLLVTQNLDDVFLIADRILILNAGLKITERRTAETTVEEVVSLILGSVEEKLTPAVWALSNYFEVRRQAEELDRLNNALKQRAVQLQAHAEVARSVTSILDRNELLTQIVQIIHQRFGYYHTGIFLVNSETGEVVLRSSAPQNFEPPDSKEVRLKLNNKSLVGWCALHGEARLANNVSLDPLYNYESRLPDTRSELVLPLRIGRHIVGVLDLQSDQVNTFDEDDALVMQSLADQLAIAIRNADLFDAAEAARDQADKANRLKSVFLSNMSHELRTPLSAIIGLTQAMLDPSLKIYPTALPPEYQQDLHTISKSGEHLLILINDILDLSKIEAGQIKLNQSAFDLRAILYEALFTTQALLHGRPVELERDISTNLPLVWADSVCLRQVVLNLLSNAVKFTERGSIHVRASVVENEIVVCVADTGVGIPDHVRQNIFDRFHRGDLMVSRKYGGSGLGLSISKQLVDLQRGRIWVESEVGAGSKFYFSVPIATPQQRALNTTTSTETPLYTAQRSVIFDSPYDESAKVKTRFVLLACNASANTLAWQQTLEREGYVVEMAAVNKLVVEMADLMLPDLLVLDSTEVQGPEVQRLLIENTALAHIPLIIITSAAADSDSPADSTRQAPLFNLKKENASPQEMLRLIHSCLS